MCIMKNIIWERQCHWSCFQTTKRKRSPKEFLFLFFPLSLKVKLFSLLAYKLMKWFSHTQTWNNSKFILWHSIHYEFLLLFNAFCMCGFRSFLQRAQGHFTKGKFMLVSILAWNLFVLHHLERGLVTLLKNYYKSQLLSLLLKHRLSLKIECFQVLIGKFLRSLYINM